MEVFTDIRYSSRILIKKPGFALLAILTLSLGIAANTSVFSLVNAVLLRPFPYADPDRLLLIEGIALEEGYPMRISFPDFSDLRERARSFEQMAAYRYWGFNLSVGDDVERVSGLLASVELNSLLGIEPHLGRSFRPEEDRPGGPRVALISHGLWQRHHASRPDILEQEITLDGEVYSVIGVMPPGFEFPENCEIWAPLALNANRTPRDERNLRVLGRLRDGMEPSLASREMKQLARRLEMEHPESNASVGVHLVLLRDFYVENVRPRLLALSGIVCFVLLIACVNVANLLAVRNASREKEIVFRAALGAPPGRLFRLLLTESLLLALLGGASGLLMSFGLLELFLDLIPVSLPFWLEIEVDGWAFLFTLALSTLTGVLIGALPASRFLKVDLHKALKETEKRSVGSLRRRRSSGMLVALEVGLTEALLVAAALAGLSFLELQEADLGFEPGHVLTAQIALPEADYSRPDEQRRYFQRLLEALDDVPGVGSAAVTSRLPLRRSDRLVPFTLEHRRVARQTDRPVTSLRIVSPKYFESLGIKIMRGRAFLDRDDSRSQPVLIANATFARLFFPQEDPIGHRLRLTLSDKDTPWLNVVGIVADVADYGPASSPRPAVYVPVQQFPNRFMDIALRISHAPEGLASFVRQEVLRLDSNLPVFDVTTMEQIVEESHWQSRFFAILFAFFAVTALVMAAVGLYGVVSYSVRRRTPEIAIRMSFGAGSAQIFRLVTGEGMRSVAAGLALGSLAALGLGRTLSNLLFGVSPADPVTFAGVVLFLGTVAFLSCLVPALHAIRIDPITNLRSN